MNTGRPPNPFEGVRRFFVSHRGAGLSDAGFSPALSDRSHRNFHFAGKQGKRAGAALILRK